MSLHVPALSAATSMMRPSLQNDAPALSLPGLFWIWILKVVVGSVSILTPQIARIVHATRKSGTLRL